MWLERTVLVLDDHWDTIKIMLAPVGAFFRAQL